TSARTRSPPRRSCRSKTCAAQAWEQFSIHVRRVESSLRNRNLCRTCGSTLQLAPGSLSPPPDDSVRWSRRQFPRQNRETDCRRHLTRECRGRAWQPLGTSAYSSERAILYRRQQPLLPLGRVVGQLALGRISHTCQSFCRNLFRYSAS